MLYVATDKFKLAAVAEETFGKSINAQVSFAILYTAALLHLVDDFKSSGTKASPDT